MSRHKLADENKKPKISITLDEKLSEIMEEHIEKIGLNRSKYIENLIRKDFEKKGYDITPDIENNNKNINWILDIGVPEYTQNCKTYFNIFDISTETPGHEHLLYSQIKDCLRFSSYEEALNYSKFLREKYWNEIDRLYQEKSDIIKKFDENLEKDRLSFDRREKLKKLK